MSINNSSSVSGARVGCEPRAASGSKGASESGGTSANSKGVRQYGQGGEGRDADNGLGNRKRLSLNKSSRSSDADASGRPVDDAGKREDTADMAFDQLMVLLQQALHEVPASLVNNNKKKR